MNPKEAINLKEKKRRIAQMPVQFLMGDSAEEYWRVWELVNKTNPTTGKDYTYKDIMLAGVNAINNKIVVEKIT